MPDPKVPQPGPAKLTKGSGPDEWLKAALNNQHLPEAIMKKLCEMCKELLMEGRPPRKPPISQIQADFTYYRIQHSASFYPSNDLWRSAWSVL